MELTIIILLAMVALLMGVCYSILVVAGEADRRADRMYRKWKEEHERSDSKNDNRSY